MKRKDNSKSLCIHMTCKTAMPSIQYHRNVRIETTQQAHSTEAYRTI